MRLIIPCARSPTDFFSVLFIRSGLVHSPMRAKKTGLPSNDAASTRNGRVVPGQFPVHAMRALEAASEFHAGCAGCSLDESRPAAVKRIFQSNGMAVVLACFSSSFCCACFCGGIAWKYVNRPCGSSIRLIMPESTAGGSVLVTTPGVNELSRKLHAVNVSGLCRYQYCNREGRAANTASQFGGLSFFST